MIPIVSFSDRHERLQSIFERSAAFSPEVDETVRAIIDRVREDGDAALADLSRQLDGVPPAGLPVPPSVLREAYGSLSADIRPILSEAADRIRSFHEKQVRETWYSDEENGVVLGQRMLPVERAGVYVPGGTAAYPSTVLMNVIPAQVAGVPEIVLASPPGERGRPHTLVCAAAHLLGVERVYPVGGAQAVAALAYGTESVPRVDKIVGPGNVYVAAAKRMVYGRVDIDSVAGPSEIVVLADADADAEMVAADLLAQAEHDRRASAVLVTTSWPLGRAVCLSLEKRVAELPRRQIAEASLRDFGACIVCGSAEEAVEAVNELAPEHLELLVGDPWDVLESIRHAGAVFIGPHSPEPVGDYFAGPNHVLPTGGTARYASALGVEDFVRRQSVIAYSEAELRRTGARIAAFARAESLEAHARAIEVRTNRPS